MFIHKIFHLNQSLDEARERVTVFGALRELTNYPVRCDEEGTGHFEIKTGLGQRISADIQELPDSEPNRLLFQSVSGNLDIAGMIEFVPIRANLTEVVLTLDYEVSSSLQRAFDMITSRLDSFLNRQLARLEVCLQSSPRTQQSGPGFLAHA